MKKTLAILIAAAMMLTMTGTVFAAQAGAGTGKAISKDAAKKIALKDAGFGKSKVKKFHAEYDKEDNVYEVEFIKKKNRAEYEYDISAADGRILEKSVDFRYKHTKSKKKIGKDRARSIAAKHAGVSLSAVKAGKCKYKYKHHEGKYEVKFRDELYKYDYEILAPNGKIMEYDYEYIGK